MALTNPNAKKKQQQKDFGTPLEIEEDNFVPDIAPDLIPLPLRKWVLNIAEALNVETSAVAIPALHSVMSLIGSRAGVQMYKNNKNIWYPNAYGLLIARPSMLKSPILRNVHAPLVTINKMLIENRKIQRNLITAELKKLDIQINDCEGRLKETGGIGNAADKLTEDIAALLTKKSIADRKLRYFLLKSATVEATVDRCAGSPGGVALLVDEANTVFSTFQKKGQEDKKSIFLELNEGGVPLDTQTISRGDNQILSATLSFFGGIQPGVVQSLVDSAVGVNSKNDDGLMQRMQMIVKPSEKKFVYTDISTTIPSETAKLFFRIEKDLPSEIEYDEEGKQHFTPKIYHTSDEAKAEWRKWREYWLTQVVPEYNEMPWLQAHFVKNQGLLAQLSLTFAIMDNRDEVKAEDIQLARKWVDYIKLHVLKVYNCKNETDTLTKKIIERIKSSQIKDGETVNHVKKYTTASKRHLVAEALHQCDILDWCRVVQLDRNSAKVYINPAVTGVNHA